VAGLPYCSKFSNLSLLCCGAPTLLPNVFAEDFTPQRDGGVATK